MFAGTPISTPPPGPTGGGVMDPHVLPLGDGFLALWVDANCAPGELRAIRLDDAGSPRDAASVSVGSGLDYRQIIGAVSDGTSVWVAWRGTNVSLARIDADATVTTLATNLSAGALAPLRLLRSHGHLLLVFGNEAFGTSIQAMVLDLNGAVIQNAVPLLDPSIAASSIDVVGAGDSVIIGWISAGQVQTRSIPFGDILANRVAIPAPATVPQGNATNLELATDGTHVAAFWSDSGVGDLRVGVVANGASRIDGPYSLGAIPQPGDYNVGVLADGYNVVVPNGNKTTILRLAFDGGLLRSNTQTMATSQPSIASNRSNVVAVWWSIDRSLTQAFTGDRRGAEAYAAPVVDDAIGAKHLISLRDPIQHVRKLLPFMGGVAALWTESAPNARLTIGRLTASGKPLDGAGLRLRDSLDDQLNSAMATNGERLLVVWTEGLASATTHALFEAVVEPGTPLTATVKQLATDALPGSDPGVVWNGQNFVIAYRRATTLGGELLGLRVDRSGNAIDPAPIVLVAKPVSGANPRIAWNGSEYLVVWQSLYVPFVSPPGLPQCDRNDPLGKALYAQRLSPALTPLGAQLTIEAVESNSPAVDAQNVDVTFAGDKWLVFWWERRYYSTYTRIDRDGTVLNPGPYNSIPVELSCGPPILTPTAGGGLTAVQDACDVYGTGVRLSRIDASGNPLTLGTIPLGKISALEGFALTPLPLVAYKRAGSNAVFVDMLPQHGRAVRP